MEVCRGREMEKNVFSIGLTVPRHTSNAALASVCQTAGATRCIMMCPGSRRW